MKTLGDRMKEYEKVSSPSLVKKIPVIIRLDGKAFHTFTRGLKPFDPSIMGAMYTSAKFVCEKIQGFKCAYVQSDEVTILLHDYDRIETEAWFDNDLSKIVSVSASMMTAHFNDIYKHRNGMLAMFDSRAFNIPESDVTNNFLWRAQDNERNSLQNYARMFFSHKELHKKNASDIHEMLYNIGKNWATDLDGMERNGTFLTSVEGGISSRWDVLPKYGDIFNKVTKYYTQKFIEERNYK